MAKSPGVASAASSTRAAKPRRPASLAALRAKASELPDSVANSTVSAGRTTGAATTAGAADAASMPARKPLSQLRCVGLVVLMTRFSAAMASGGNGALAGRAVIQ